MELYTYFFQNVQDFQSPHLFILTTNKQIGKYMNYEPRAIAHDKIEDNMRINLFSSKQILFF